MDSEFIPWFTELLTSSKNDGKTLPDVLKGMVFSQFQNPDEAMAALLEVLPWRKGSYVTFHKTPSRSTKGTLHVGFFSLDCNAYPGNGIYLADSLTLASSTAIGVLMSKIISVRPRAIGTWKFGWEADGVVADGAHAFLRVSLAWFAIMLKKVLPQPLAHFLCNIQAHYERISDSQTRVLNNLVA